MNDSQEVKNENKALESSKNKTSNFIFIGIVVVILTITGLAFLSNSRKFSDEVAQAQDLTTSIPEEFDKVAGSSDTVDEMVTGDVKTIDVEAGSFYYNPKEIKVKIGQKVIINLISKDMMHDFNINELDVDGPIVKAGETATVEFIADKVGEFEYYCSVGQHRANGQVGTLIIEE